MNYQYNLDGCNLHLRAEVIYLVHMYFNCNPQFIYLSLHARRQSDALFPAFPLSSTFLSEDADP